MQALLMLFLLESLLPSAAARPLAKAPGDPTGRTGAQASKEVLGPVYWGETAAFWDSHTLVVATIDAVRFHDDGVSLFTSDTLALRVQESVPPRLAGARLSFTFTFTILPVRDRPQGLQPHFRVGDRLLLLLEDGKRRPEGAPPARFMMMPGGGDWYSYRKEDDPLALTTLKLCRALSTREVGARLRLIESMLKERPDEWVRAVLRRSLEEAAARSKQHLDTANRLLKDTGMR